MVVEAYIGQPFDYPHEREAADFLLKAMQSRFHSLPETYFLLQNISISGTQIDFIVLKPKAIIVMELKEIPYPFTASENGDWKSGDKIFENNGVNPYHQVLNCREKFIQFFEKFKTRITYQQDINIRFTSSFVCISPSIHKDSEINIDTKLNTRFRIVGLDEITDKIDAQVSDKVDLREESFRRLIKFLNLNPAKNTFLQGSFFRNYQKNQNFTGRENDLHIISKFLSKDENKTRAVVVTGIGGVGKTQLCIQYAYEYRTEYPNGVFWINAAGDLVEEFAQVARKLGLKPGLDEPGSNSELLARRFLTLVDGTPDVLLILDNLIDPTVLYKPIMGEFVLTSFLCRILITARDFPNEFLDVHRLKLKTFTIDEAISYVNKLLGVHSEGQEISQRRQLPQEREEVEKLCSFFGNHPFALNLAASAMKSNRIKLEDYLVRLNAEGSLSTIDAYKVINLDTFVDYKIIDLLEWHWEKFNIMARKILCLFTFFPEARQITEEKIGRYLNLAHDNAPGYPDLFEETLNELADLSLIQRTWNGDITVHPLINDFCKRKVQIVAEVKAEIAGNLVNLYMSPSKLESVAYTSGIESVKEDLRFYQTLLSKDQLEESTELMGELSQILVSDSGLLIDASFDDPPGYIKQEIRNRAHDLGFERISLLYEANLSATDEPWMCEKYSSQEMKKGLVYEYRHDGSAVNCIALFKNDSRLISGDFSGRLNIWEVSSGSRLNSLETGIDIDNLQLSPSARYVVIRQMTGATFGSKTGFELTTDPIIEIWDLEQKRKVSSKPTGTNESYKVISDSEVLFGTDNGEVVRCRLADGSEIGRVKIGESKIIAIDSSNKLIAILDDTAKVKIFEKRNLRFIGSLIGVNRVFKCIRIVQNDRYLVGCFINYHSLVIGYGFDSEKYDSSKVGDLLIWDLRGMKLIRHRELEGAYADIIREANSAFEENEMCQTVFRLKLPGLISISSKGQWAVANFVHEFWKFDFLKFLKQSYLHGSARCFEVSEAGDIYFGFEGSAEHTDLFMVLFNGAQFTKPIVGHERGVNQILLSSDEKEVYSASDDGSVKRWNINSIKNNMPPTNFALSEIGQGDEVYNPLDYSKVKSYCFSKMEGCIFSITMSNEVHIRKVDTGEIVYRMLLDELENFQGESLVETADGKAVIICGEHSVVLWHYLHNKVEQYYLPTYGSLIKCVQLKDGRLIGLIDTTDMSLDNEKLDRATYVVADLTRSVSLYEIDTEYRVDIFSSACGGWLFSSDRKGSFFSEDLITRTRLFNLNSKGCTDGEAISFQLNDAGNRFCVTFSNGVKEIYNLEIGDFVTSKEFEDFFIQWSLDETFEIAASSEYDATNVWHLISGKCLAKLPRMVNIKLSTSGKYAAAVDTYGVLRVYELVNI